MLLRKLPGLFRPWNYSCWLTSLLSMPVQHHLAVSLFVHSPAACGQRESQESCVVLQSQTFCGSAHCFICRLHAASAVRSKSVAGAAMSHLSCMSSCCTSTPSWTVISTKLVSAWSFTASTDIAESDNAAALQVQVRMGKQPRDTHVSAASACCRWLPAQARHGPARAGNGAAGAVWAAWRHAPAAGAVWSAWAARGHAAGHGWGPR